MAPVTRASRTLRVADQVARDLDKAWAMAEGDGNPPGPVYLEFPTDVLRRPCRRPACSTSTCAQDAPARRTRCRRAGARAELLRAAKRPLVVTGRGAGAPARR